MEKNGDGQTTCEEDDRMTDTNRETLEEKVSKALTEGEKASAQPDLEAVDQLSPEYEMRQVAKQDPIVEESKKIRSMAREVDGRYDDYLAKAEKARGKQDATQPKQEK
jgi:hypothetical protein